MEIDKIDEFLMEISSQYEDNPLYYPTDLKNAIVGVIEHSTLGEVLLLDKEKCIEILCEQGLSEEDAIEHFYYNVIGTKGEDLPAFATFID